MATVAPASSGWFSSTSTNFSSTSETIRSASAGRPSAAPVSFVASDHGTSPSFTPTGAATVGAIFEKASYCSRVRLAVIATIRSGSSAATASGVTSPAGSTSGCSPLSLSVAHGQVAEGRLPVNSRIATGTVPRASIASWSV